jgi:hypothetical protein
MTLEADDTTLDTGAVDESMGASTDAISTSDDVAAPIAETPADAKPVSMDETIRAKFRELNDPVPPADAPVPEGKLRDPKTGRFVDKPKAVETAKADKAKPVAKVGADGKPVVESVAKVGADGKPVAETPPAPAPGHEKAPTSWNKGAQAKYNALDPEVKAMVHQREADFHKGIEQYKGLANIGQSFVAEFQPYEALIRASGQTPQNLVKAWMNAEYQLKVGTPEQKAALFVQYAKDYGIDLAHVTAAAEKIAAGQPAVAPVDPKVAALEQQVQQLTGHFTEQQKVAAQREYSGIVAETRAFGQKPENKHYEAVKLDMAALMESGRAESLQDAYDKAVWANPETRALLLAEQQEVTRKLAADKAAAARKAAGANVATRGTLPAAPAKAVSGTMEDTIRATYRKLNGQAA